MDPVPPDPHFPSTLLALLARLTWIATSTTPSGEPIGIFFDGSSRHALLAVGDGPGRVAWAVGEPPKGFAPHLCDRHTAEILQHGALDADGAILWQGARYRVRAEWDGSAMLARAGE